uniref:Peptidase S26 domain-containing protein n=1 Tax=Polytomella parva TaxID=51329 RepID=A0A7S0UIF4_9CHLO|mmetsp:Transcript_10211/g.18896  ORF Transcript_10211/g.18896 Transcript_10211/m.18896 type:complete len:191 (+) Transcript_10211:207-779(+)|eukprot:CAMPEP_0175040900 /NCGR_PEP_ID=MMETSP0052_2-20121109/1565_1 /TAXON_ID=51329 ORGANISM="Polytomella parva, Strain SAG 63-3" /NCGR_SAMPLE_ID=MMETSP0052_2 /ASSEMBLY_ACC=CAM_ASM_000194 /LENGTH=190 /DNA_ID=CAMNT_0016303253 /DNA_START=60 /DNA_END=632 /DNA_ORIENTATION=-
MKQIFSRLRDLKPEEIKRGLNKAVVGITQVFAYSHLFSSYIASSIVPVGRSMQPTIESEGDVLLVEHVSVNFNRLSIGDVVTSVSPDNPRDLVCKRIVALEGEVVEIPPSWKYPFGASTLVPKGHVWLQGDNPSVSKDSRIYGSVPINMIEGRVFLRCWPLGRIQMIDSNPPPEAANASIVRPLKTPLAT